jgi:4-carboxymuconolactone decarboxylase
VSLDEAGDHVGMPRLRTLVPADLDDPQRQLYDRILGGPRANGPRPAPLTDPDGGLRGPFNAMLYAPQVGEALQALGAVLRYRTALTDRAREIAILAVAAHWDSGFERYAHEAIGRTAGLTDDIFEALRSGTEPPLRDETELAVYRVAHGLLTNRDLDDAEFADARDRLGESTLVELSTLVGYYGTIALQLRLFRVPVPGQTA